MINHYQDDLSEIRHRCVGCGDVLDLSEGILRTSEGWMCEACRDDRMDDGPCFDCGCDACHCDDWEASAER